MASTVVMPQMGYDMTQGKIVHWLKKEGDRVEKGEPIAEIETEKVNIQIESFASGVLTQIVAHEGDTIPVGQPIAMIGEPGEAPAKVPTEQKAPTTEAAAAELPAQEAGAGEGAEALPTTAEAPEPRREVLAEAAATAAEAEAAERIKASPVARRMAEEHGVELSQVQGTGPGGRITKEDVESYLTRAAGRQQAARRPREAQPKPAPQPTPPAPPRAAPAPPPQPAPAAPPTPQPMPVSEGVPTQSKELSRMGQAIARRMAESNRTIPHFYVTVEADMSRAVPLREELNRGAKDEEEISYNDFILKATAMALKQFPMLNAALGDGRLELYQQVNLAIAVAVEQGLIAPVIKDCDQKSLQQIARESRALTARTREGMLRQEDYSGATFTVSNMGMLGVDEFAAIITPGQASILAVGAVAERPVVRDGILDIAHTVRITLSVDHRVANGADGARFLGAVKQLLEEPGRLLR